MEAGLVEGFGRGSMNKGIRVSSLRLERFQVHRFLDLKVQMLWGSNFVLVWAVFGFQGPKFWGHNFLDLFLGSGAYFLVVQGSSVYLCRQAPAQKFGTSSKQRTLSQLKPPRQHQLSHFFRQIK